MRHGLSLGTFLALAACVGVPEVSRDDIVPAREIAALWEKSPYECVEYRAATETCEVLIRYDRRGAGYSAFGRGALSANPPITFDMGLVLRIRGDSFCARSDDLDVAIGNADPGLTRELTQAVRAQFAPYGEICTSYYRAGGEDFVSITRDERGEIIEQGTAVSRFFGEPQTLRF